MSFTAGAVSGHPAHGALTKVAGEQIPRAMSNFYYMFYQARILFTRKQQLVFICMAASKQEMYAVFQLSNL